MAPQDWDAGVAGISPDIPGMVVEGPPSVVCWPSMGPWRRRSEGHDFQPGFQRGSLAAGELECPLPPLLQQGQGLAQADGPDSLARLQRSALVQASDSPLVLQGQRLAWRRWQQRLQQVLDALIERAQAPALAGCGRGDRASSGDPSRSTPCRPP